MQQSPTHQAESMSRAWLKGVSILLVALTLMALTADPSLVIAAGVTLDPAQTEMFLHSVSTYDEKGLTSGLGLTPIAAAKILAFRKGGKSFSSLAQVREVSALSSEEFDRVQERYRKYMFSPEDSIGGGPLPASSPPPPLPAADRFRRGTGPPAQKDQAAKPVATPPAAGGSGLDLEVKSGYYSILPGYDLEKLDPDKRKRFLDTINREKCSCGCNDDTLGACLVNDPGCVVVKARVRKVYTDIFGSAPQAPSGSTAAH